MEKATEDWSKAKNSLLGILFVKDLGGRQNDGVNEEQWIFPNDFLARTFCTFLLRGCLEATHVPDMPWVPFSPYLCQPCVLSIFHIS